MRPVLEKGEGVMKKKALLKGAILVAVALALGLFLSKPATASSVSFGTFGGDFFTIYFGTGPSSPAVPGTSFPSGLTSSGGHTPNFGDVAGTENTPAAHSPIPTTLLLLGSGLVGVVAFRKRFRR